MTLDEDRGGIGIFLVTPPDIDPAVFPHLLAETLAAAPVAAVLIASQATGDTAQRLAETLVPIIQAAGAAAIISEDTRIAGRVGADGIHVASGRSGLETAIRSMRPKRIVGAGALDSRHAAMEAGELEPDYLFFGKPHGDTFAEPHPRAADLAEWWSDLMEIPAVLMLGDSLDHLEAAKATGTAFLGVHRIVWEDSEGAPAALKRLHAALRREEVAA